MIKKIFRIGACIVASAIVALQPASAQKRLPTLSEVNDLNSETFTARIPMALKWVDDDSYLTSIAPFDFGGKTQVVSAKTGEPVPYSQPAGAMPPRSKLENWQLSPDGTWAAYTENGDLWGIEIASGRKVRYTTDGSSDILNGKASWLYYEEVLSRSWRTFWWAPDGKHIAFFRTDESKVPIFPIQDPLSPTGASRLTRYPTPGDPNPQVRVGIVGVEGGAVTWADFDPQTDQYFGQPFWAPDGKLWVQWMPRVQKELKIYSIDVATGAKKEVYGEQQKCWVMWKDDLIFLKKQQAFLVCSDVDGWNRIYLYGMDGTLKNVVSKGKNFWNTKVLYVDEATKTVWFTSNGEIATRNDLYSAKLDGSDLKRLTYGDYTHMVKLSPTAKYFITNYSNTTTPPRIDLCDARTGKVIRQIADSRAATFDSVESADSRIVWYTTSDGLRIPALIMLPPRLDTTVKHPVMVMTYGGPDHPLVADRWWGAGSWQTYEGIIRVVLDHRGSGNLGKRGLDYLYRDLGKYEMSDFIDFVKGQLYTKSWVDRDRITMEGMSYGGYMTAMALTCGAEYFRYGIADAGVMDWRWYDSHYTERYMGTPQDNPEGYKQSSVFTYVDNYKTGRNMIFIRHGNADDNVHVFNSINLADRLQLAKKPFALMLYPGCAHGFIGPKLNTSQNEYLRFWYSNLLHKEVPAELLR